MAEGEAILNRAGIPTYPYADTAARAFNYMWRSSYNLKGLYETPTLPDRDLKEGVPARRRADAVIESVRSTGRRMLTELESKQILEIYGLPVTPVTLALDEDQAVTQARQIGYPVVLKLHSHTLTHKTDVGGVQLDLSGDGAVRQAFRAIRPAAENQGAGRFQGVTVQTMVEMEGYELILGSSVDPQFGPVLLFGWGGSWSPPTPASAKSTSILCWFPPGAGWPWMRA